MRITKIRHSTILIETNEFTIYLDPYLDPLRHRNLPKADLILITNPDYDHGNQESVTMISTADTRVYGPVIASNDINLTIISPGDEKSAGRTTIRAMPSAHPSNNCIGYIIESEAQRIYYPGDTPSTPTVAKTECTILILPISLDMLNAASSATLALTSSAQHIIPVHFGALTGTIDDAKVLKRTLLSNPAKNVIVLNDGESVTL